MFRVPTELEELKIFLWQRFKALRDQYPDPGVLQIAAQLSRDASLDSSSDAIEMPIACTEDLECLFESQRSNFSSLFKRTSWHRNSQFRTV